MSRKYLNEKWCVRCGRTTPCPYLLKNIKLFEDKQGLVIDCGCGNGRNSNYLKSIGFKNILSLDMAGDVGEKCVLGKDKIPAKNKSASLILCNYVFMFLDPRERLNLFCEINRVAKDKCFFMLELYPAKDSYFKTEKEILAFQDLLYNVFVEEKWTKIKYSKQRFILQKQ